MDSRELNKIEEEKWKFPNPNLWDSVAEQLI